MSRCKKIFPLIFICILCFFSPLGSVIAENTANESDAQINAYITKAGELPLIDTSNWTGINLTIEDTIGMNWSLFKDNFFNDSRPIYKLYNLFVWSLLFNKKLGVPIQNYLGYCSLRFKVDTSSEETQGWFTRITPNTITNTTTGKKHDIELEVKIKDAPVSNSIILRLNCTRYDAAGLFYGTTFIDIPLKANPEEFIAIEINTNKTYAVPNEKVTLRAFFTNNGFYKDTFFFILDAPSELVTNMNDQVVVLESGERRNITFNVLAPDDIIDFGTPYLISLSAYSSSNEFIHPIGSYTVIVRGVHGNHLTFLIMMTTILAAISLYVVHHRIHKSHSKKNNDDVKKH